MARLQCLGVGVGWDGGGQVVQRRLQGVMGVSARGDAVADDQYLGDGAAAAVGSRKRVVDDYYVGGEGVKRHRVRVDKHRVGGANRLQVRGRLVETWSWSRRLTRWLSGQHVPVSDAGSAEMRALPRRSAR